MTIPHLTQNFARRHAQDRLPLRARRNAIRAAALAVATALGGTLATAAAAHAATPADGFAWGSPLGALSSVTVSDGNATATGYAIDTDNLTSAIRVAITVDGKPAATGTANLYNSYLAGLWQPAGAFHGYSITTAVTGGTHRICATGVNIGQGHDSALGCSTVSVPGATPPSGSSPVGKVGTIARDGSTSTVGVSGWALDPDVPAPISVRITLDGSTVTTTSASIPVTLPAPWTSPGDHGFIAQITASPSVAHQVCVIAVDASGDTDTNLGCRTVPAQVPTATTPPGRPRGLSVTTTATTAAVSWLAPASTGGAAITGYVVRRGLSQPALRTAGRSATITGLQPSTTYRVSVAAVNAAGTGAAATVQLTTKAAPSAGGGSGGSAIPPQRTPAPVSTSHYLRNLTGVAGHDLPLLRAMGANDARHNPAGHRYLVLQDIGAQAGGGVLLSATIKYITYSALVRALEAYIDGYAGAQRQRAPMLLAVGTNNDGAVSYAQGRIWSDTVVEPLIKYAKRYRQITVAGANDIEPGFSAGLGATRQWLAGYLAAGSAKFVFNGSADGCPTGSGSRCNNGWTTGTLHWLAGGAAPARVLSLPQIYNTAMPQQWRVISAAGSSKLRFGGPLTEYTACQQARSCYSASNVSAWRMLHDALAANPFTAQTVLPYGTDLRIN